LASKWSHVSRIRAESSLRWASSLAELEESYRTLKQHNVTITETIDHLITKSNYFLDPDGNGFELYCDVGENGLERLRHGEASASTRLNLDA
jgi:catechol-2,3-dioxygenase